MLVRGKKHFVIVVLAIVCWGGVSAQRLVEVGTGYSQTSVNTTVFRNNSLVTHKNIQFISYYDADGYMVLGKRKLTEQTFTLHRTQYRGNVQDAHNVISMMVDGEGFLHVSFDHHGHPLHYAKSVAPYSLELTEELPMTGDDEGNVTYPEFYRLANGDLIFAYRSGSSGRGNLVINRYDVAAKKWNRVQDVLIDGENQRNAYWQIYVDIQGTIHVSWVWRETWLVETNHDLCYARSKDGGLSWERSNGEKYTLPITAQNAEYAWHIPQGSELINQTSMFADEQGNPYIATYWRDADQTVPQYRLVWLDGGEWRERKVSQRTQPFSLSGGGTKMIPISRPRLVAGRHKGRLQAYYIYRDEERGSRVTIAYANDLNNPNWVYQDLTSFSVEAWEPSLDTELWKHKKRLQIFVQCALQGDGERVQSFEPQKVYVLEVDRDKLNR